MTAEYVGELNGAKEYDKLQRLDAVLKRPPVPIHSAGLFTFYLYDSLIPFQKIFQVCDFVAKLVLALYISSYQFESQPDTGILGLWTVKMHILCGL